MPNFDRELGPPVKEEAQSGNQVFATPNGSHGFGLFRSLVSTDIPSLAFSKITGTVPVNQGGTNLTSYTTGQLLYASGSGTLAGLSDVAVNSVLVSGGVATAPSYSSTPTIGGLITSASGGITFNANPGGGTQSTLNDFEVGTWVLTDTSGAGLTLTVTNASYIKIGKNVNVQINITYPTTADTSQAMISLPFTCTGTLQGLSVVLNSTNVNVGCIVTASSTNAYFPALPNTGGGGHANVTLSGGHLVVSGSYTSAS